MAYTTPESPPESENRPTLSGISPIDPDASTYRTADSPLVKVSNHGVEQSNHVRSPSTDD